MNRIDRRTQAQAFITRAIQWWRRNGADESPERAEIRERMSEIAGMNIDTAPDEIDRRIGKAATWSACDSCGDFISAVIEMGEEGYEVRTCRDCLLAALELLPEPREVMP